MLSLQGGHRRRTERREEKGREGVGNGRGKNLQTGERKFPCSGNWYFHQGQCVIYSVDNIRLAISVVKRRTEGKGAYLERIFTHGFSTRLLLRLTGLYPAMARSKHCLHERWTQSLQGRDSEQLRHRFKVGAPIQNFPTVQSYRLGDSTQYDQVSSWINDRVLKWPGDV